MFRFIGTDDNVINCTLTSMVGLLLFYSFLVIYVNTVSKPKQEFGSTFLKGYPKLTPVAKPRAYIPKPELFGTVKGAVYPDDGYRFTKETKQYPNIDCSNNNCDLVELPLQYNNPTNEVLRSQSVLITPYNCTKYNYVK